MSERIVAWFSAGAASAVAAKMVLGQADGREVVIAYADPGSEHPDNARFLDDCERWFSHEVLRLQSPDYADTWEVWEKTGWLVGEQGARCTTELKRRVRFAFQRPSDRQVFGYTVEEAHGDSRRNRVAQLRKSEPAIDWWFPLVDAGLTKADCLGLIERAGIELPVMYRLGYDHNNCVGCPKGAIGYWNRIRVDFPATFDRMAKLERKIGHAVNSEEVTPGSRAKTPVWLDELDPDRGDMATEPDIDCSLLCAGVEASWSAPTVTTDEEGT